MTRSITYYGMLLCLFFSINSVYGQQTEEIFTRVEKMPEFPGGQVALVKYIHKNLKYPVAAKKAKLEGKVLITFVVDKTGRVADAKVTKSLSPECDTEALRVVQHMPAWAPGEKEGKPVSIHFTLPIQFELTRE